MKTHSFVRKCMSILLLGTLVISSFSGFIFANSAVPSLGDMVGAIDYEYDDENETADVSPNIPQGKTPQDDSKTPAPVTTPSKTSDPVGQALPLFDIAAKSGTVFPFQVTAPAGASVTATLDGKTYELSHSKKVKDSTYVIHKRNFKMPDATGTVDLGTVEFRVTYKDKTYSVSSTGKLFAVGSGDTLKVQIVKHSAMVFGSPKNAKSSGYRTVAYRGAVDTVTDYHGDMYKLGTGGWINAANAAPLTANYAVNNPITSTDFSRSSGIETITLNGATHPIFKASQSSEKLTVTFYRTTGVGSIDVSDSNIFSDASVSEKDGHTTLVLQMKQTNSLWGYAVEYNGGNTKLICKAKPKLSDGDQPLAGITIALDAGHGGKDQGTSGIASKGNWVEKDANLAITAATKAKLEGKGATVVLVRPDDVKIELSDRLIQAQAERADLFISLHCNSASNKSATGVEIYYFHANAAKLASNMLREFTSATNRKSRSYVNSHYIVTLGSFAPSILLEMGFMTNVGEYNDIVSKEGIQNAADGVYNGILAALR